MVEQDLCISFIHIHSDDLLLALDRTRTYYHYCISLKDFAMECLSIEIAACIRSRKIRTIYSVVF